MVVRRARIDAFVPPQEQNSARFHGGYVHVDDGHVGWDIPATPILPGRKVALGSNEALC